MVLGLDQMGESFAKVTFNGVNEKGLTVPKIKLDRLDSDYEPPFGSKPYFTKRAATCCTQKTLHRKLPITSWLRQYTKMDFIADLIAGITVGFTIIPQSIAFSELANLPAQYGLYSGYIGSLVYIILGTTKEITIGPAAVICILIGGATHEASTAFTVAYASVLCFVSGLFSLFLGFFKLGVIVEFISAPVVAGFVSAAAIVIVASQLESIFGLHDVHGEELIGLLSSVYQHISDTNYDDLVMAAIGIVVLIFMQEMKRFISLTSRLSPEHASLVSQIITIVSAARNAIMIVVCAIVAYFWNQASGKISLTAPVNASGMPEARLPLAPIPAVNETVNGEVRYFPAHSIGDVFRASGSAIFIIPIICVVEQIAVCKTFAKDKPVDVNQEMISLGASQFLGSFFQSMPVTGSICRSCVNAVSGVRTPLGGIWSGMIVISALLFFTPYLEYIPKPALAAIVVCAVVHMIEYEEVMHIWHTKKRDMIPLLSTFFCCLFIGLEWGFLIGVVVNVILVLIYAANPGVPIMKFSLTSDQRVIILRPDRALLYPGIAKVRHLISKKAVKRRDALIVVDCIHLIDIDFTGAKGLGSLAAALMERGQKIIFVNVAEKIEKALRGFTHGTVETFETAQQWIDTLTSVKDRKIIVRSMSTIDDMELRNQHPHGLHNVVVEGKGLGSAEKLAADDPALANSMQKSESVRTSSRSLSYLSPKEREAQRSQLDDD